MEKDETILTRRRTKTRTLSNGDVDVDVNGNIPDGKDDGNVDVDVIDDIPDRKGKELDKMPSAHPFRWNLISEIRMRFQDEQSRNSSEPTKRSATTRAPCYY